MQSEYDLLEKLVLVGDQGVGKSSLLHRFAEDAFSENYQQTIGVDFVMKIVDCDGMKVKLQLWDTAGAQQFRALQTAYYRGAMGYIIVYDCTNNQSFAGVRDWVSSIQTNSNTSASILLVGNKCDEPNRTVATEQGMILAQELGIYFYETSAKNGINVSSAFFQLVRDAKNRQLGNANSTEQYFQQLNQNFNEFMEGNDQKLEDFVRLLNRNGNGIISTSEFQTVVSRINHNRVSKNQINELKAFANSNVIGVFNWLKQKNALDNYDNINIWLNRVLKIEFNLAFAQQQVSKLLLFDLFQMQNANRYNRIWGYVFFHYLSILLLAIKFYINHLRHNYTQFLTIDQTMQPSSQIFPVTCSKRLRQNFARTSFLQQKLN